MVSYQKSGSMLTIHQSLRKAKKVLPNNYRPVSLTSIVCRVLEKLVRQGIVAHIKFLIVDEQRRFMEGRPCSSQLISVLDVWTQILDKKESLDAVYLDFQKGFRYCTSPKTAYETQCLRCTWIRPCMDKQFSKPMKATCCC